MTFIDDFKNTIAFLILRFFNYNSLRLKESYENLYFLQKNYFTLSFKLFFEINLFLAYTKKWQTKTKKIITH